MVKKLGFLLVLALAFQGCKSLDKGVVEEEEEVENSDVSDFGAAVEEPAEDPEMAIEVNWRQWICCWDVCGKKNNLQSLKKSNKSKYLECLCKDGRLFELRKKDSGVDYQDTKTIYQGHIVE